MAKKFRKKALPMAICSFLGHRDIYDANIDEMLQVVIERIIEDNESVEFLIYHYGKFSERCMLAAWKASTRFPKKVTISYVTFDTNYKACNQSNMWNRDNLPECLFDRVIICDIPKVAENTLTRPIKRLVREIINMSDYVINCLYEQFHEEGSRYLKHVRRNGKPIVIDIANQNTVKLIAESVCYMTDREQSIFSRIENGESMARIAKETDLSSARIHQILACGIKTVRNRVYGLCRQQMILEGHFYPTCGILGLERTDNMGLAIFEKVVRFLIFEYGVRDFFVDYSSVDIDYVRKVMEYSSSYCPLCITSVTDEDPFLKNKSDIVDMIPWCKAIRHVGFVDMKNGLQDGITVVRDIIKQATFCICGEKGIILVDKARKLYHHDINAAVFTV